MSARRRVRPSDAPPRGSAHRHLEVLEALDRQRYDLVLMDMRMPDMDGVEASRELCRRLAPEVRPAIVAMTANARDEDRRACLAAGMDGFVSKPVGARALAAALEEYGAPRLAARRRTAAA